LPNGAQAASLPAFEKCSSRLCAFKSEEIEAIVTALQAAWQAGSLRSVLVLIPNSG